MAPISYQEIAAYCALTATRMTVPEVAILRALDMKAVEIANKALFPKQGEGVTMDNWRGINAIMHSVSRHKGMRRA